MSLSTKTTIPIILMGVLLSLSAYLIQTRIIYPAFTEVEVSYAKNNIDRAIGRLASQLDLIDFTVYDWSAWDDTYQFIEDRNQAYIESNLAPETFLNYGFDVVLFLNREKEVVWGGVYDFSSEGEIVDTTADYLDVVLPPAIAYIDTIDFSADIDDQAAKGVFLVGETPVLFSTRPVVRSDGTGSHRGHVLFGQFLTDQIIEQFSQQIVLDFDIAPIVTPYNGPESKTYSISSVNRDLLLVSRTFNVDGVPSLRASASLPRSISRLGSEITFYGISLFILLCLTIVLTLIVLFQWVVIKPIRDLRQDISKISSAMDYSMRASIKDEDEIGSLSKEFNTMLGLIESNNTELLSLNAELESEHKKVLNIQNELEIANQELKKLSEKDGLTGLANRYALERKLEKDWSLLGRTRSPLTILMIDIDYFKAYNDLYGHLAGDRCLKTVANIIGHAAKRSSDMAARYGGEEFIVVLPGTQVADALDLASALRAEITDANIEHSGSAVEAFLTLSIGVSSTIPSPEGSPEALISSADAALYQVKENGRNNFRFEPMSSIT